MLVRGWQRFDVMTDPRLARRVKVTHKNSTYQCDHPKREIFYFNAAGGATKRTLMHAEYTALEEQESAIETLVDLAIKASAEKVFFEPPPIITRNPNLRHGHSDMPNAIAFDFDRKVGGFSDWTLEQLRDHAPLVAAACVRVLREQITNATEAMLECCVIGDIPADKGCSPSYHVFFPNARSGRAKIPKEVYLALAEQPELASLEVDKAPDDGGLSFGPSSKRIKGTGDYRESIKWAQYLSPGLLARGYSCENPTFWRLCTGKDWDDDLREHMANVRWALRPLATISQPGAGPSRAAPAGDNLLSDQAAIYAQHQTLIDKVHTFYRRVYDGGARQPELRMSADGSYLRFSWQPGPNPHCKHGTNRHWAQLWVDTSRVSIMCGTGERERIATYRLSELDGYEPVRLPENATAEWARFLAAVDRMDVLDCNVGTLVTQEDAVQAMAEAPDWLYGGSQGWSASLFSPHLLCSVWEANENEELFVKLMNFQLTYDCGAKKYLTRDQYGNYGYASLPQVKMAFSGLKVPDGKKKKDLLLMWFDSPFHAQVSKTRSIRTIPPPCDTQARLRIRIPLAYPPLLTDVPQADLERAWSIFTCMVNNLVSDGTPSHVTAEIPDAATFQAKQRSWIQLWAAEVLMSSEPIGLILHLMERAGGAGKSMFIRLMEALLGKHQTHWMRSTAELSREFNAELAVKRLWCLDDAEDTKTADLKNASTATSMTTNHKYGANSDTRSTMQCIVIANNHELAMNSASGDDAMNRRIMCAHASHNLHTLLASAGLAQVPSHRAAMGWVVENLINDRAMLTALSTALAHFYQQQHEDIPTTLRTLVENQSVLSAQYMESTRREHASVGDYLNPRILYRGVILSPQDHDLPDAVEYLYGARGRRGPIGRAGPVPMMVEGLPVPPDDDDEQQRLVRPMAMKFISVTSLYRGYCEKHGTKMTETNFEQAVVNLLNSKAYGGPSTCHAVDARYIQYNRLMETWEKAGSTGRKRFLTIDYEKLTAYVLRQRAAVEVEPADLSQVGRVDTNFLEGLGKRGRVEMDNPDEGTLPMDLEDDEPPPKDKGEEVEVSEEAEHPYFSGEGAQEEVDFLDEYDAESPLVERMLVGDDDFLYD